MGRLDLEQTMNENHHPEYPANETTGYNAEPDRKGETYLPADFYDEQLSLFEMKPVPKPPTGVKLTIQQRFERFHDTNPQVYEWLVAYTREMKGVGVRRYSIKGIYERLRYSVTLKTKSADTFRLSNDYTSRYARLIMKQEGDLDGFFSTRELRSP